MAIFAFDLVCMLLFGDSLRRIYNSIKDQRKMLPNERAMTLHFAFFVTYIVAAMGKILSLKLYMSDSQPWPPNLTVCVTYIGNNLLIFVDSLMISYFIKKLTDLEGPRLSLNNNGDFGVVTIKTSRQS